MDVRKWEEAYKEYYPYDRALKLSKYLLYRTSPANDFDYYGKLTCTRLKADNSQVAIALSEIFNNALPDDNLSLVVKAAGELEESAESLVLSLVDLLQQPERANQQTLIYALGDIGSREAIPALKALVEGSNEDWSIRAKHAIAKILK